MADCYNIGKCWKCHNSPTNGAMGTKLRWSHPILSPTWSPWYGCHGNGHCLATVHWTFSSYGRLEAKRVNQFWWNLVHNSKLRPQWPILDQTLKIKMVDGRHIGKCWKCRYSPTNEAIGTKLGWSFPIMSPTCPPWCGCHGNGRCLATVHWTFSIMGVWRLNAWTYFD